jgi:SAM-dependent methyltransferase
MAAKDRKKNRRKKKKFLRKLNARTADRHILYEASVQCVEADIDFFERVFKKKRKRPLRYLREDFCGTAALACEFLRRHPDNTAIGVDLDQPTLDWGIRHHVSRLGDAARRLALFNEDVRTVRTPPVDLVAALNFSYSVFKTREELRLYFSQVRRSLNEEGVFILDAFGGTDAMDELEEDRKITSGTLPDGTPLPPFVYVWDQAKFNVVNHHILCHIHFKFHDGSRMKRAFTYDWRLWTLPELQEILLEAGFAKAEVYLEGWDDEEDEADGIFRRRKQFENMAGWVGYVVGLV